MKKTAEDYILQIQEACAALGWKIAMNEADNTVSGLIIGDDNFITDIIENLNIAEEFDVWENSGNTDNGELH